MSDLILKSNNPSVATGKRLTPFFAYLYNGTDYDLNKDYSGGAVDAYWEAPRNAIITMYSCVGGDANYGQGVAVISGSFFTNTVLTNGTLFYVKNQAGTIVHDFNGVSSITVSTIDLLSFMTDAYVYGGVPSGTVDNNELVAGGHALCEEKHGGHLFLPEGYRFVVTLNDNLSGLSVFKFAISGYYA